MLQNIRAHAQGWIAGAIIGLIIISFALWGIQDYLGSGAGPSNVAKVNGSSITANQLNVAYERLRQEALETSSNISLQQQKQLKQKALQQLITLKVLAQAAHKRGLKIDPQYLRAAIMHIPAFQINGRFSPQRFQQVLSGTLFTEKQFLTNLSNTILVNQMQSGIIGSTFALSNEVNKAIKLADQKRNIDYFIVPSSRFKQAVKIEPAAIEAYYKQHKDEFIAPEQVRIAYLELSAQQLKKQIQVTEQQIKDYYDNNINRYSRPKRWQIATILFELPQDADAKAVNQAQAKAEKIYQEIQSGKSFTDLARQVSGDDGIKWVNSSGVAPGFAQKLNQLKVNQVSKPFRSNRGVAIVKLMAIDQAKVQPFADVKDKVRAALIQQKLQQEFSNRSNTLSTITYTNPNTLSVAAKALGLKVKTTGFFQRDIVKDAKKSLTTNPKIVNSAFSNSVLKQNNNSNLLEINDGTVVVLRVKQHKPSHLRPLSQVKGKIEKNLRAEAAQEKAAALGQTIIADLKNGEKPDTLASKYNLKWHTYTQASRHAVGVDSEILRAAFNLPKPKSKQDYSISGLKLSDNDYAVIRIAHVVDGIPAKASKQQRNVYKGEIENSIGQLDYALYVKSQMDRAKIERKGKD